MIDIIPDLDFDPHILYHVSPKLFDRPCRDEINRAREWSPWHSNGVLGLWCSTLPEMCSAFGTHTYMVDLHEGARCFGLALDQFQKLTSHAEDYAPIIDYLLGAGDVAYIIDSNPHVGEVIVLNLDTIRVFERMTHPVRDRRVRLDNSFYRNNF